MQLATQRPALVLTGARQTGKSSLLRRLFPKHQVVTLDVPLEADNAERDPTAFLSAHPPPLIIDEIQYAPKIFRHLKVDIDRHREQYGRYILTGSQKFTLMQGVSDSLAGRVGLLDLEPLAFGEIGAAIPEVALEQAMFRGGYPELWASRGLREADFFSSYFSTYLERDVRALLNVGSLRDFDRFVRACALRSGQMLNKSELARDVGIRPTTAGQWLSVLEASNQVTLIEPWFSNKTKSLVKTPKLYFNDTGFMCWLSGIRTVDEMLASPYVGAIWETLVCAELRKRVAFAGLAQPIFYFRERDREVDFLFHRGGRYELLEAKWSRSPDAGDTKNLRFVSERLGIANVTSMKVVCRTPTSHALEHGIQALPLTELELAD